MKILRVRKKRRSREMTAVVTMVIMGTMDHTAAMMNIVKKTLGMLKSPLVTRLISV